MKNLLLIIIIILAITAIVLGYGYFKLGWFQKSIDISKGTVPDVMDCQGNKVSSEAANSSGPFIIGTTPDVQCTKPLYDLSGIPDSNERCFTASDLLLKKGDVVPAGKYITRYKVSKQWRLNRQSGNKFCYVYSPTGKYPPM